MSLSKKYGNKESELSQNNNLDSIEFSARESDWLLRQLLKSPVEMQDVKIADRVWDKISTFHKNLVNK